MDVRKSSGVWIPYRYDDSFTQFYRLWSKAVESAIWCTLALIPTAIVYLIVSIFFDNSSFSISSVCQANKIFVTCKTIFICQLRNCRDIFGKNATRKMLQQMLENKNAKQSLERVQRRGLKFNVAQISKDSANQSTHMNEIRNNSQNEWARKKNQNQSTKPKVKTRE